MDLTIGETIIRVVQGDITEQAVDAVVNAANSSLLGGGGVDGAIHRRGGPEILEACRALRRSDHPDGLPPGEAAVTTGGRLPARWVVHTVGPIWKGGGEGEADLLRSAYVRSLQRAEEVGATSIAFPSISTGAFGYPVRQAASIAMQTLARHARLRDTRLREIRVVTFSPADTDVYRAALEQVASGA